MGRRAVSLRQLSLCLHNFHWQNLLVPSSLTDRILAKLTSTLAMYVKGRFVSFLPRDAMHSAVYASVRRLSLRLSR